MKKSNLPNSIQDLLETMQRIRYGEIKNLSIRNGQPHQQSPPTVERQFKFSFKAGPRPEAKSGDFELCAPMADFVNTLEQIGEGVIRRIEVKDGLPFRMSIEE